MLTAVSVDGLMTGCDMELINNFQNFVNVPLIYRGLSSLSDIKKNF